jgi:hypothetical protein
MIPGFDRSWSCISFCCFFYSVITPPVDRW